jgi:transcription initiation factor IIE alpha subunit
MLAMDPDAVLVCAQCGHVDVNFEGKSEQLVRCSLCSAFVEIVERIEFPENIERPARVAELRGRIYLPTRPRSAKRGRAA